MSITLWIILVVLFGHWMSDFLLQPHWMGMRKSKEWWVLIQHGLIITLGAAIVGAIIEQCSGHSHFWHTPPHAWSVLGFALFNGAVHIVIDAVTSRMTGKAFAAGKIHKFFTIIGFDQFLHYTVAFGSVVWLLT